MATKNNNKFSIDYDIFSTGKYSVAALYIKFERGMENSEYYISNETLESWGITRAMIKNQGAGKSFVNIMCGDVIVMKLDYDVTVGGIKLQYKHQVHQLNSIFKTARPKPRILIDTKYYELATNSNWWIMINGKRANTTIKNPFAGKIGNVPTIDVYSNGDGFWFLHKTANRSKEGVLLVGKTWTVNHE